MAVTTFQHGPEQRFEASQRAQYNGTDGVIWIERRKAADGGWMHWGKRHLPLRATRKEVVEQFGSVYRAQQVDTTKTTITEHDDRHVTIKFTTLDTDQEVSMDIWAPMPGKSGLSYVRYNGDKQLCSGLSAQGQTLSYSEGTKLVDLVRREYRAMRAAERRELARHSL